MDGAKPVSFWNTQVAETDYPRLESEVSVDVAVIGGGIAGMTAAVLLKRSGRRVALLEARRVGRQVTGHSNAKLTAQHGLIYADLIEHLGEDAAQRYADANQSALQHIADQVAEHEIACDFERRAAYCFTRAPDRVARLEAEYEAAIQLGLPASLHGTTDLPYPVEAALRFDDQAQINPTAYVCDLAARVAGATAAMCSSAAACSRWRKASRARCRPRVARCTPARWSSRPTCPSFRKASFT